MLAKARDESDAQFDAYFYWLCDGSMSYGNMFSSGGGGGGASFDGAPGWDRDASSSRMNGVRWNGLGYVDRLTGDPVSYDEVHNNYIAPKSEVSLSGEIAQALVGLYQSYGLGEIDKESLTASNGNYVAYNPWGMLLPVAVVMDINIEIIGLGATLTTPIGAGLVPEWALYGILLKQQ